MGNTIQGVGLTEQHRPTTLEYASWMIELIGYYLLLWTLLLTHQNIYLRIPGVCQRKFNCYVLRCSYGMREFALNNNNNNACQFVFFKENKVN